ncbi:hypothetical protein ARAM_004062 [Aspergillus rambellii]|uniref:Pre-rRNA processing protein n=1 Tax=Aspergillus rambellii TaxID=308745 RepID=A0A0F8X8T9_9EURO|nr:hypothetical protein ARAM_004062 [Aspergillus rambellii]
MADEASRPLLTDHHDDSSPHQNVSTRRELSPSLERPHHPSFEISSESTPLLHCRNDELSTYGGTESHRPSSSASDASAPANGLKKSRSRIGWTLFCILLALSSIITILILAFFVPTVVKLYVKEATVFKPTNLSIESTTSKGIRTRVQGDVVLDANRIKSGSVRNLGRFATWIGKEVETGDSEVEVYLPQYGNILVGTASLPSIKLGIRNGHVNHLDFEAELVAGNTNGLRSMALDWLEGRLEHLSVLGRATMHLKSGLLNLGEQTLTDSVILQGDDFPPLPDVAITKFLVHDLDTPESHGAIAVDGSVSVRIDCPLALHIPPLGFEVLVGNCAPDDPYISVADVVTKGFTVNPGQATVVDISGIIRGLSDQLTTACPGEKRSPLDSLLRNYIDGLQTTVYIRGADTPYPNTPQWIVDILKSVTVPLPFTGKALDDLVKNFTMTDVHFSLPNPLAEPDSPESSITVSALVKVLIAMPEHMDFHVDVPQVRATADVYYRESKLGVLDLHRWQPANSTFIEDVGDNSTALLVEFSVQDAPLEVADDDVLTDVLQTLIFEGNPVKLTVSANVDAEVSTGLGEFAVRGIPADGALTVQPPYGGDSLLEELALHVASLELGATTESSLLVKTTVNFTNPTQYSASVPLVDFKLLYNDTKVAHLTAKDATIKPGNNTGLSVDLLWSPLDLDGPAAVLAGQDLLSQYVSGFNTSVMITTHKGTIPALPKLGQALSRLGFEVQIPKLPVRRAPGDDPDEPDHDDGQTRFIQDATLHLWSSTADFTLSSPFTNTTLEITSIEAQAFYEHDQEVGTINYYEPFPVPPGVSQTPRLPVDLNLGGIGYDAVKRAVGGTLHLDTVAKVGVKIEDYSDTILYHGNGITARVKL